MGSAMRRSTAQFLAGGAGVIALLPTVFKPIGPAQLLELSRQFRRAFTLVGPCARTCTRGSQQSWIADGDILLHTFSAFWL
jgi:hypothetical protein